MERIADYQTVEQLGEGSGGQVWRCQVPSRIGAPAPEAAVKVLNEPTTHEAFHGVADELKLYATADGARLVQLYDVGLWSDHVYIAMEYVPDGSLATASLDRDGRAFAVACAARGVHALHERGVVHRALKPSNILLTDGAGKTSEPGLTHLLAPRKTLTGAGAADTVEYMEQGLAHGDPPARASDIWSLGACLQFALTGGSLYGSELPRDSLLAMLRHVFTTTVEPSSELEPQWQEIVGRCIVADRAERYPTAAAFADDVDRVLGKVSQ